MATGPDGSLFILIPRNGGSVLASLDRDGRSRPGWPIVVNASTHCDSLSPVEDGSVRVLCTLVSEGNMYDPIAAFSFDSIGSQVAGWPVALQAQAHGYSAGRVIGEELVIHAWTALGDIDQEGQPGSNSWITTVAADGTVRAGAPTPFMPDCCSEIGPDAIAYAVTPLGSESRITAMDLSGVRAGWPVEIDGIASEAAFGPGGRIVVVVGPFARDTSRILVFESGGKAASAASAELPISTVRSPELGDVDCARVTPVAPVVGRDGTIFVFSDMDTAVGALDASLAMRPGWPFEPATRLERPYYGGNPDGISCSSLAVPAVGPDSTLYLPLQARTGTVGGSILAVGPDGRVRPGWPVELQRPGAEFWSVVVGSDGTAYALAIEPEAGESSSASILAFAPDSTVLYSTTIVEP